MKILGVDEIPEEWKNKLNLTGLARYGLFVEELNLTPFVLAVSSKGALDILTGIRGEEFPYKDLKIGKPTLPHWKILNRAIHMGVLIQNNKGVIQLLEGTLDATLIPTDWSHIDHPNITF
ncbi:hypothetical protein H7170_00675 [Candidatus Gracilibacteria bacterium]|nr:hypothetical protein [Candidatus Gracilibacteria bacterium]